jgi:hypothetical protein
MTPNRLLSYGLAARLTLLVQASVTMALAWLAPNSLTAYMIREGGDDAMLALLLFSGCVVLAWVDLLINDAAPPKFTAKPLMRSRHLIYALMGVCYFVNVFSTVGSNSKAASQPVLLVAYMAIGICCGWYSTVCALRGREQRDEA